MWKSIKAGWIWNWYHSTGAACSRPGMLRSFHFNFVYFSLSRSLHLLLSKHSSKSFSFRLAILHPLSLYLTLFFILSLYKLAKTDLFYLPLAHQRFCETRALTHASASTLFFTWKQERTTFRFTHTCETKLTGKHVLYTHSALSAPAFSFLTRTLSYAKRALIIGIEWVTVGIRCYNYSYCPSHPPPVRLSFLVTLFYSLSLSLSFLFTFWASHSTHIRIHTTLFFCMHIHIHTVERDYYNSLRSEWKIDFLLVLSFAF